MDYWEILKRDAEGNKYEIRIRLSKKKLVIDEVGFTPKGKRKVTYIGKNLTDDYEWRRLNSVDRRKAQVQAIVRAVPKELLEQALIEVWESLQPEVLVFY